jgi:hypothetical protein
MRKWFKIMRLGFEYLNPARTFHSLRLMADVDGTLDHRAELMRAWSTNKALMAQAGLISNAEPAGNVFLGVKVTVPADILAKRTAAKAKTEMNTTHTNPNKKKNKKKKKSDVSKVIEIMHQMGGHKKKEIHHVTHIPTESVDELDKRVGIHFDSYKAALENSLNDIASIINMIPPEQKFSMLIKSVLNDAMSIKKFTRKELSFDDVYLKIAHGTYRFITNVSIVFKQSNHKYYYPSFFNWKSDVSILQKGFLVHELLTMLLSFLQRNLNVGKIKSDKSDFTESAAKLRDAIYVLVRYKGNLDKIYSKLYKAKENLRAKAKKEREENPRVSHAHLNNLKEDIEEVLHHDGTIQMGQPFDEY